MQTGEQRTLQALERDPSAPKNFLRGPVSAPRRAMRRSREDCQRAVKLDPPTLEAPLVAWRHGTSSTPQARGVRAGLADAWGEGVGVGWGWGGGGGGGGRRRFLLGCGCSREVYAATSVVLLGFGPFCCITEVLQPVLGLQRGCCSLFLV